MIRFYSSFMNNMYYPYQICAYYNAKQIRRNCTILIVDSGFGKRPVGVVELANIQRKFADISVAPDIFKNVEETVKRTKQWNEITKDFKDKIAVIQGVTLPDYMDCYEQLETIDDFEYYGIGGLIGRKEDEIIRIIKSLLPRLKKEHKKVHVFGIGCSSSDMLKLLIKEGVDSFDSSSTVRNAIDGQIITMKDDSLDKIDIGKFPAYLIDDIANMNNQIMEYKIKHYYDIIFNPREQKTIVHFSGQENSFKNEMEEVKKE